MKKLLLSFLVLASFIACNSNQTTTSNAEDANIALFKENSEIVKSLFDNFVKNDFSQNDNLVSDTVKHDGPSISAGILDRASGLAAVKALRALYVEVNYSELQFYPAVDSINYKPDGNVRVYSKWTGIGKNGDTVINKYFSAFLFNADHKVIKINEFFNAGDVIKALTAEKK